MTHPQDTRTATQSRFHEASDLPTSAVAQLGRVRPEGECLVWTGSLTPDGYPRIQGGTGDGRYTIAAHRAAYLVAVGPLAPHLVIDHLCRNRACVNPAHLEAVTTLENVRRGNHGLLQTHCKRGHEFTESNTLRTTGSDGYHRRVCRECAAIKRRKARSRA